ncbi:MAG: sporulation protein YtxC [Bacillus sp. (in: firmicutes)]
MVQIHFENEQQAEKFRQIMLKQLERESSSSYISYEKGNIVDLHVDGSHYEDVSQAIGKTLLIFIQSDVISQWLSQIVREKFLYDDPEECEQIVDIALYIIEEERVKNASFWEEFDQKVGNGLMNILERKVSFSFPSFLTFRMRGMMDSLLVYVESAIDEYKMEQEYQSFVHTLRNYMLSISSKLERIHLTYDFQFQFYDHQFNKLEREQLVRYIDRKLFSDYPMYIDSHVLAPLISMAPRHVSIYSDEENNPLVVTIQRIFEERVEVLPKHQFYIHSIKNR